MIASEASVETLRSEGRPDSQVACILTNRSARRPFSFTQDDTPMGGSRRLAHVGGYLPPDGQSESARASIINP